MIFFVNRRLRSSTLPVIPQALVTLQPILPAQILLVERDLIAGDPHQVLVPQDNHDLCFVSLFHHSNSSPKQSHAITLLQRSLLLLLEVVLSPQADDVD
jgi:hypothetical protein